MAKSFPKPLTISEHTLRAVDAGDLSRREWAWLRFQSRLHSKEGRGFAMRLAEHNVPIMTINGWTQRIIPPPKYPVQRLVSCELSSETTIDQLYIIERGVPHHSLVPQSQAIVELLENTEDAYGFPPYRYLAQALSGRRAELRRAAGAGAPDPGQCHGERADPPARFGRLHVGTSRSRPPSPLAAIRPDAANPSGRCRSSI